MTDEELITQIKQLPLERQKGILDAIENNVWKSTSPREERGAVADRLHGIAKPGTSEGGRGAHETENGHGTIAQHLYGILEFESGPPTDEEVKDIIADYLAKKYY
jgi:hypothetical protein